MNDPLSTDTALTAITYSNQANSYAIAGVQKGTGAAGRFEISNTASTAPVISINNLGKGNAITANSPIQATQFIGSGALLTGLPGLVLPYTGTDSSSFSFQVENNGSTGRAAFFRNSNAASSLPALEVQTNGSGPAISTNGIVNINGTKTQPMLNVSASGGAAALFSSSASTTATLQTSNSANIALSAFSTGTNNGAAQFSVNNVSNTAPVINITQKGTGNAISADAPIQATQFIGDGSLLTGLPPGFTLPYNNLVDYSGGSLFGLTNSNANGSAANFSSSAIGSATVTVNSDGWGALDAANFGTTGLAGMFRINNASNPSSALQVTNVSGTGPAATFQIQNALSTSSVLNITSAGTGNGIDSNRPIRAYVTTENNEAGSFTIFNALNNTVALSTSTNGTNAALNASNFGSSVTSLAASFSISNPSSPATAVAVSTNGTGNAMSLTQTGSGFGAQITLNNPTNASSGINVVHAGEGSGINVVQNKATGFGPAISAASVGNGSTLSIQQTNNGRSLEFLSGGLRYNVADITVAGAIATRATVYNITATGTFTISWTPLSGDAIYVFNNTASAVTVEGQTINAAALAKMIYIGSAWRTNQ